MPTIIVITTLFSFLTKKMLAKRVLFPKQAFMAWITSRSSTISEAFPPQVSELATSKL
jgi:hypothetical protein